MKEVTDEGKSDGWLHFLRCMCEVFSFDEDGLAEACGEVASEYEEAAKEARDDCPVSVIDIVE